MSMTSDRLSPQEPNPPASFPPPLEEAQLAALFSGVTEAVYIEELESRRIVYWSPRAAELFGYDAARILQQSGACLFADEADADLAFERTAGELQTRGCWHGRRRHRRADGVVFDGAVTATLLRCEPKLYSVTVVSAADDARAAAKPGPRFEELAHSQTFDMLSDSEQLQQKGTERKQGEQMVGQLLRNVVNCALFTTDSNGYIRDWNKAASSYLGYERADVCGKHLSVICGAGQGPSSGETLRQAAERGTLRYNQWMTRKDGKGIYASVAAFALWGEAQPRGFLFLVQDDSRERSYRQKLREREQMAAIGTAASMLAHEIGNPLNGISATVQLLEHFVSRENFSAAQAMVASIHDLKSEIHRLTTLLNEFKNIAWPQKLALAPVDVPRLIQSLVGLIEKRASRQKIDVSVDCQEGLPQFDGDADKLKEALLHVLDNAVEAMPSGGRLKVKAYQCDEAICIDVSDSGVGIPENFKVFDLFSSTKPHGTGFGLFIVQQIVLAHDGTITYSSTPGQGTTFHLVFPAHPSRESLGGDFLEAL